MKGFVKSAITVAMLSVFSTGCSTHSEALKDDSRKYIQLSQSEVGKEIAKVKRDVIDSPRSMSVIYDQPVLNIKKTPIKRALPSIFSKSVSFDEIFPVDIKDFFVRVSGETGLKIDIEDDVIDKESLDSNSDAAEESLPAITDSSGMPIMSGFGDIGSNNAYMITLSYSGDVKGLMDSIASKIDGKWRYDHDTKSVVIYKYIDQQFSIPSLSGSSEVTATIDDSLSSSSRKAEFKNDANLWESIKDNLNEMIAGGDGGYFTLSESSGVLTVRTSPEGMKRVSEYVKHVKDMLRTQVLIDVQIYSINVNDSENREVNFQALLEQNGWSATVGTGTNDISLAGATSFVINSLKNKGNLKEGSGGMLDILNKAGKTSLINSVPIRTINNQPAAVSSSTTEPYLAKSEVTSDPQTGVVSNSLTTDEKKVGLSLNILPSVDENGRDLMLQIALNISNVLDFRTFESSDGSKVALPSVSSRDFVNKTWLRSGETLMLTGFDFNRVMDNKETPFGSNAWVAGGSKSKSIQKEQLVILITSRVYNAVTKNSL